jgi:hypothetical protein
MRNTTHSCALRCAFVRTDANASGSVDPRRINLGERATVSLTEAALVLGIHRSTAWELHKRGEFPLPVLRVGHRLLVAKVHLERFLLSGRAEDESP